MAFMKCLQARPASISSENIMCAPMTVSIIYACQNDVKLQYRGYNAEQTFMTYFYSMWHSLRKICINIYLL